jgi:outer membrane protein OmpA-like peptidoglycan-associated protein
MKNRVCVVMGCVLALVLVASPGCVSNKMFRNNSDDTDRRIVAMESAIEGTDRKVDELAEETGTKIASAESQANEARNVGNSAMTKAIGAEKAARGKLLWSVSITDDKVKFEFGETVLTAGGISSLDGLVDKIKSYGKALYIEIEGHTDSVGNENENATLGEMRAAVVRSYLNQNGGIPLHAMNTISYGESRPVADNSTDEGRGQNRRVVIRVLE